MKTGFIGCGNMASAIIGGILSSGISTPEDLVASDSSPAARERIVKELKISSASNRETAMQSDILFLSVKPQFYPDVISEIADCVRPETVIVTIAPGKTLAWLREQFGRDLKIVRTMPNTPAMVKEGMTGVCPNAQVTEEDLARVMAILESFGKAEVVPEHLLDVVTSVSGSSPAYVFVLIEAMADGAVADGMPRAQAYKFAAQAVLGSARMVLETGRHPGELKDMVCSPGGTTMEAVRVLEEKGFRSAVIEAEKACVKKSRGM
ncbi:MAG: pyrroline-5-carboxylate reductase [Lachnospiraceae bacterium]|nr:pyrroline-5-carboxylate reductase [Lachnospiraceae bacterium]